MTQFTQLFLYLLIVQMFYAFSVTIFVPLIPDVQQQQVIKYADSTGVINFSTLGEQVEGAVGEQSETGFVELGTLIFYSTSIVLNLVVNFFTAVPQMITWLLAGLFLFVPIEYTIQFQVKMLFTAMITIMYWVLLILFIMGARTQSIA